MPWSNQNGGPWGQKGGSGGSGGDGDNPWGSGGKGGGGGNKPPNLDDILRQGQDRLKNIFSGGGGNGSGGGTPSFGGKGAIALILGAVIVWLLTGFYIVRPNEMGVNMRFGRYTGSTGDGLSYNFPYPIGQVLKFDVTAQRRIEIGLASVTRPGDSLRESLMLTGDENIVDVSFYIDWRIDSGAVDKFAFTLENPANTIKVLAESAMREVIGRSNIQAIITTDQTLVAARVQEIVQQTLDSYQAGVMITAVQIQAAVPPAQVRAAFLDVNAAQQDAARAQNLAERDASQILPKARGSASEMVQQAEAYRSQVTAEASGQAAYFSDVYAAYSVAPEIIRERIFLETMERVFRGSNKTIIDQNQGPGVLPFLPLAQTGAK